MNLALEVGLLSDEAPAKKVESLFFLHRSALKRGLISDLWQRKAATAPAALADVLLTEPVVDAIRKGSGYNPEPDELVRVLRTEFIKSEHLLK